MIILGWIGVVLFVITLTTLFCKSNNQTFLEGLIDCCKVFVMFVGFLGFLWLTFILVGITFKKEHKPKVNIPTILVCGGNTVAESIDGFYFYNKSGTYEDYKGKSTYTPRQGEVCKEYLKGSE